MAKLLTRLTKITAGELLINDVNIDAYDPVVLRSHISVLFQDVGEFSGLTISENIGIGNVGNIESSEAIHQSAADAGAAEFIEQLPHQYDSYLGHIPGWYTHREGIDKWDSDSDSDSEDDEEEKKADEKKVQRDLSGGQWQKLGLARAFMRGNNADLMVLDEPTASLDPEAEHRLFETIKKSRRQRTTVFISHRFNTVRVADRIMVMEKGEVEEFGTHEELMMQNGKYRQLYNIQAKGFVVNEKGEVSEEVDGVVLNLKLDV